MLLCNLDLTCIWSDVLVVWLYQIQFRVELTPVECPSNLYTSMQRHPCTPKKVRPTLAPPFLVVSLNSLSPSMVLLESPYWDLLTFVHMLMSNLLFATLKLWYLLEFHLFEHSLVGVCNMFLDIFYPLKQFLVHMYF